LSFQKCTIRLNDQYLYRPEWGSFDLACGKVVVSVFGGAADRSAYFEVVSEDQPHSPARPKTNLTEQNRQLNEFYSQVRAIRSQTAAKSIVDDLKSIAKRTEHEFPRDWLLPLEILELVTNLDSDFANALRTRLLILAGQDIQIKNLIERGLETLT
jgi:phenylalanine-4-hydroxylase